MPKLLPFFRGLCRRYCESNDLAFAMAAEVLIDGIDLDASWYRMNLNITLPGELIFALKFVKDKDSRIFDLLLG